MTITIELVATGDTEHLEDAVTALLDNGTIQDSISEWVADMRHGMVIFRSASIVYPDYDTQP